MYDTWEYQIPAGTSEAELIKKELGISLGIITDVYIGFPAGCAAYDVATTTTFRLARCRLKRAASMIVPRSPKQYVAADDFVVHAGPLRFPVLKGDPILTWELWNLDDTYPHELWIGINWLTQAELERMEISLDELNKTMKELTKALQNPVVRKS